MMILMVLMSPIDGYRGHENFINQHLLAIQSHFGIIYLCESNNAFSKLSSLMRNTTTKTLSKKCGILQLYAKKKQM